MSERDEREAAQLERIPEDARGVPTLLVAYVTGDRGIDFQFRDLRKFNPDTDMHLIPPPKETP